MLSVYKGVYSYDSLQSPPRFVGKTEDDPGFSQGGNAWSVMKTKVSFAMPTYFGRVIGINTYYANAEATAAHRPRDISIVLDFSGSMKFGCEPGFYMDGSSDVRGSLNPDPIYPKFGPYYAMSQRPVTSTSTQNTPSANGTGYNPMQRTCEFVDSGGEAHAANNLTINNGTGGPPVIQDFLTKDGSGNFVNAFYNPQGGSYSATQTPTATPAPDNFQDQTDSPVTYVGDKFPRKGTTTTTGTNWAATVREYWNNDATVLADLAHPQPGHDGQPEQDRHGPVGVRRHHRHEGQQRLRPQLQGLLDGAGLLRQDVLHLAARPAVRLRGMPVSISLTDSKVDINGKYMCDWRKRFFLYGPSHPTTSLRGTPVDDNSTLFSSSGYINTPSSTTFAVNYDAILAWIKAGPKVFPDNLRAGRVLYYSSIPSTIPSSGLSLDQLFWKKYIDMVLGVVDSGGAQDVLRPRTIELGQFGGTPKITAKSSLTGSPAPYMHYNDNPIRPRAALLVRPADDGDVPHRRQRQRHARQLPGRHRCTSRTAGNSRPASTSALDDIQKNHPNDWAAMMFFSNVAVTPRRACSWAANYTKMKNALFFPNSLLNVLADTSQEIRPYDSSWTYTAGGDIPNARGGTCPHMGLHARRTTSSAAPSGYNGRQRRQQGRASSRRTACRTAYSSGSFTTAGPTIASTPVRSAR